MIQQTLTKHFTTSNNKECLKWSKTPKFADSSKMTKAENGLKRQQTKY